MVVLRLGSGLEYGMGALALHACMHAVACSCSDSDYLYVLRLGKIKAAPGTYVG